eukprot:1146476-Pelagomonas_calceolata.AAC.4
MEAAAARFPRNTSTEDPRHVGILVGCTEVYSRLQLDDNCKQELPVLRCQLPLTQGADANLGPGAAAPTGRGPRHPVLAQPPDHPRRPQAPLDDPWHHVHAQPTGLPRRPQGDFVANRPLIVMKCVHTDTFIEAVSGMIKEVMLG